MSDSSNSAIIADAPSFGSRYQLLDKLGSGGMGAVFLGYDSLLDRNVAVKLLLPSLSSDVIVRFHNEAKLTARLDHPNILRILDFGQTTRGELYLVMDYIEGKSLEQVIEERGSLGEIVALDIFEQLAKGLSHAHKQGILHRDVKPSNVMISKNQDGGVLAQLVDFGLAKIESDDQSLTRTGVRVGSPLYMSPEQALGQDVDMRSDIYSFGCLMYKSLAGVPPLAGDTYMDTISRQIEDEPPALASLPAIEISSELSAIVSRCLNKDASLRYQSTDELLRELSAHYDKLHARNKAKKVLVTESNHSSAVKPRDYDFFYYLRNFWHYALFITAICIYLPFFFFSRLTADRVEQFPVKSSSLEEYKLPSFVEPEQKDNLVKLPDVSEEEAIRIALEKRRNYFKSASSRIPEIRVLFRDVSIDETISEKRVKVWLNPEIGSLGRSKELRDLAPRMLKWLESEEFDNAISKNGTREFLLDPENWRFNVVDYPMPNDELHKLLSREEFAVICRNESFQKLLEKKAFRDIFLDKINWKFLVAYEYMCIHTGYNSLEDIMSRH